MTIDHEVLIKEKKNERFSPSVESWLYTRTKCIGFDFLYSAPQAVHNNNNT